MKRQLLTDRSLVHIAFSPGSVNGVMIDHTSGPMTFNVSLLDLDDGFEGDRRTAVMARVEWQVVGESRQHQDLTSFPGDEFAIRLGAGVNWTHTDSDADTDDDFNTFQWTVDASLEFGGATLYASAVGSHTDSSDVPGDQYGVVIQGGVFVWGPLELIARYEWGDADDGSDDLSALSVGFNYYFNGHQLKYTFDAGYAFSSVAEFWTSDLRGWRTDGPDGDGQVVIRSQFQLLFWGR